MKYCCFLFSILYCSLSFGQENYSKLTGKALETMWSAKDSTGHRTAFQLYEEAFHKFPDSIDDLGRYKASVLASNLKEFDKAFKYLEPLANKKFDEDGYPGWSYILGKFSEDEYKNLLKEEKWSLLRSRAEENKKIFFEELNELQKEFFKVKPASFDGLKEEALFERIRTYNPYMPKKHRDYSISFPINDSVKTSYFVHLPEKYDSKTRCPVLLFLHGAVYHNSLSEYQVAGANLEGWNRYYTKYAKRDDVILVFVSGSAKYNWMHPDDGFFMIPEIVKQIKKSINIDDNKIFISGHSNGATGSFSYLMKNPNLFAGMYGFNTQPKVFTGGTFVENIKNRAFVNFSTDQDYYYPPKANDSLTMLMQTIDADYKDFRYNGFPHWFPEFDESEPAYQILFEDLKQRKRNPYPKEITWEFDDNAYGNIDWLSEMKLDTLSAKAKWHQNKNFAIKEWLRYDKNDSLVIDKVDKKAFDFPRKSGKVVASYKDNVFEVKTSHIKSFRIYISPEMVDLRSKIKVYVNDELVFNKKVGYDTHFMMKNFKEQRDRKQLWVNYIDF